jgi:hypothetical protein
MTLPDPETSVASAAAASAAADPVNGKIGYCYSYKSGSSSNTCSATNTVPPSDLFEAEEISKYRTGKAEKKLNINLKS